MKQLVLGVKDWQSNNMNSYTKLKEESHNPLAEKVVIRTEGHTSYNASICL